MLIKCIASRVVERTRTSICGEYRIIARQYVVLFVILGGSMELIFEEENVEAEIDINKRFQFPKDIVIRKFENKNLIIYTKGVLWLVFDDDELEIYKAFDGGLSIQEVLNQFDEEKIIGVLSQIEAKQFEHPIVRELKEKNIYIYLTNNCNERCKHCYMYAGDIKIEEMPPDVWKRVLFEYKACGGEGVTFTGGEVTVYKGFETVLRYAHELGLKVTILTNGILWGEQDIQRCTHYIDEVQISIDGYDRESYFKVRQFDGFDRAVSALIGFSKAGVRTSMAVTPLCDEIEKFVKKFELFARKMIEDYPDIYIRFNLELLNGRDVQGTQNKNAEYRKSIKALVERLYPNYYLETFPLNYEGNTIRKNCGFGEIAISANGDIFWCNRIHELSSSWNIKTSKFDEIIRASEKIKVDTDVDHSSACRNCEVRYICGGDCRMNYIGISNVDEHHGIWENTCPKGTKENLYRKMILSNEYFYVDIDER